MAGSICIDRVTAPYHPPVKYSVTINGHQTSISLEPLFWEMLRQAAEARGKAVNALVAEIDAERIKSATPPGLAGAIRIWLVTSSLPFAS
jgi:predicted DNA-binding ribbon-helix-helix protein